jgi:hypothetical protein
LRNVGDLHDLILSKKPGGGDVGKCATAMAFYRLRRALAMQRADLKITPDTEMREFRAPWIKQFYKRLEQQTGMRLGGPIHTWMGWLGDVCVLLPLMLVLPLLAISLFVHFSPWLWVGMILSLPMGLILQRFDPGRLTGTVGDLARKAADLNYGRLLKQGAQSRDTETWRLIVETLTLEGRLKSDQVTRETVFFRSQLKAA